MGVQGLGWGLEAWGGGWRLGVGVRARVGGRGWGWGLEAGSWGLGGWGWGRL